MSERCRMACWVTVTVLLLSAGCSESTAGPSTESAAQPDRGMIVFADHQLIWRIQPDGSGLKAIGLAGRRPMLSPDLSRIGVTLPSGGPGIANLDGSGLEHPFDGYGPLHGWMGNDALVIVPNLDSVTVLTLGAGSVETVYRSSEGSLISAADVSPDGKWMVAARRLALEETTELVLRRLDPAGEPEALLRMPDRFVRSVRFSPDGQSLAVGSVAERSFSELSSAITVVHVDGAKSRVLEPENSALGYRWPAWSPDGDSLLVNRLRIEPPFFDTSDLVVVSLVDGGERVLLVGHESQVEGPHWRAPDG